jgi:hypothetical protein
MAGVAETIQLSQSPILCKDESNYYKLRCPLTLACVIKSVCIKSNLAACNYANGLSAFSLTVYLFARLMNIYTLLCALETIEYVTG